MRSPFVEEKDNSYFPISDRYWEQNNPSALVPAGDGSISMIGSEYERLGWNEPIPIETIEYNSLENNLFQDTYCKYAFNRFMSEGMKYGCINTGCASEQEDLYKKLYGNFVYVVLEHRALDHYHPNRKHTRFVLFFTEYDIARLIEPRLLTPEMYFSQLTSDYETKSVYALKETVFNKLFRNGLENIHSQEVHVSTYPLQRGTRWMTMKEYFNNPNREKLTPQELCFLFWYMIASGTLKDHETVGHTGFYESDESCCFHFTNIVGFGWLPCLMAKESFNEMDRLVFSSFEDQYGKFQANKKEKESSSDYCEFLQKNDFPEERVVDVTLAVSRYEEFAYSEKGCIQQLPLKEIVGISKHAAKGLPYARMTLKDGSCIDIEDIKINEPASYKLQITEVNGNSDIRKVKLTNTTTGRLVDQRTMPVEELNSYYPWWKQAAVDYWKIERGKISPVFDKAEACKLFSIPKENLEDNRIATSWWNLDTDNLVIPFVNNIGYASSNVYIANNNIATYQLDTTTTMGTTK